MNIPRFNRPDSVVELVMESIYSALAGSETMEIYAERAEAIRDRCDELAKIRREDAAYAQRMGRKFGPFRKGWS